MSLTLKKCVFFDRDGIVNQSPGAGYVERPEDFHLQPAFVEAVRVVQSKGYVSIVITNQQGVGKGLYSAKMVEDLHQSVREVLQPERLDLLDLFYCPHLSSEDCNCRKPLPGMILKAAAKHGIDLTKSWMVGDREGDVVTGHAAGCRAVLVASGKTAADAQVATMEDLPTLLDKIL